MHRGSANTIGHSFVIDKPRVVYHSKFSLEVTLIYDTFLFFVNDQHISAKIFFKVVIVDEHSSKIKRPKFVPNIDTILRILNCWL